MASLTTDPDSSIHIQHCSKCFGESKCRIRAEDVCPHIECPNRCGHVYHACKSSEHLLETCPLSLVDCPNWSNGCRLRVKRCDMSKHLMSCVACVVRCSAFRVRKIARKPAPSAVSVDAHNWPDPIACEKLNILNNNVYPSLCYEKVCVARGFDKEETNINALLLEQDVASLRAFATKQPLRFHRMYGYLIGLKVYKDYAAPKFSFMRHLLQNVRSRVFADLEAENCVVWNDESGCAACQSRMRMLEAARFALLQEDRLHFGAHLSHVRNFEEFVEKKVCFGTVINSDGILPRQMTEMRHFEKLPFL